MNFGLPAHPDPHIPRMSFGIGHIICGKYRVEYVLGEGGMGIVVAARHLELHELYAIKIMKREAVGGDHAERRFIAEARAAARLKGAHVAHVHDIGRLHTGELYMVMEYLRGVDLKRLVRTYGPLPVDLAVTYLLQACEAIAEAHALGIIHRDIKPNNLFVLEDENSIKVLDFGVAKQPVTQDTECTGTNVILGTLPYMAPEQMLKSKNVDARGDIWSLGVVLYELVTGRVPFLGDGILEVFSRISSERPMPPSSMLPSVPGAIDAVIERCLQVEPAQRYQSVQELAFALHALHAGHDTMAAKLAAQAAPLTWDVESPGGPVSDAATTQPRTRTVVAPADPRSQPGPHPGGEPQHRVDVPFEHWHVILFTDGVPTIGITDYRQITRAVDAALARKSTLSVIALHGADPTHTADAKLTELVRATLDDTGQTGEIINLITGADPQSLQPELERIAFLIDDSTIRDQAQLKCVRELPEQRIRCALDKNQVHALRFGAARKVTFIANTTGLSSGACTAVIENQGLGTAPRMIQLPEGQNSAVLTDAAFKITLLRGTGRTSVTIEMLNGRLNGDWQIALTLSAARGSEHRS